MAENPTFYPIRASEYVTTKDFGKDIVPLKLTETEKQQVLEFESQLYEKLKPALDIKNTGIHSVFPGYFATNEGWKLFRETYGPANPEVNSWRQPKDIKEATTLFFQVKNLKDVSLETREKLHDKSTGWAKETFCDEYQKKDGDTDKITNPIRVARVSDPKALLDKVNKLRGFKAKTKKMSNDLEQQGDSLSKGEQIVLSIYRRYVNVQLANAFEAAAAIGQNKFITEEDKNIIAQIRKTKANKLDRFSGKKVRRTLERIDHFLEGVGSNLNKKGNFSTIPEKSAFYIETKSKQASSEGSMEKRDKWQDITVDAQRAQKMVEEALTYYGLLKTEGNSAGWTVAIKDSKSNLSVQRMRDGKVVNEIVIPSQFSRTYIEAVRTLSHEVEGHVLRHANRDLLPLKLLSELSSGRGNDLSESAAVWVEDKTLKEAFGIDRTFKGVYYWAMRERQHGLSFKRCYKKVLELIPEAKNRYKEAFRKTLRIFEGGRIPLSDKSQTIVNSEELSYHEPTAEILEEKGLEKLMFMPGVDLYTVEDLMRLGIVDWDKIKTPDFIFAKKAIY